MFLTDFLKSNMTKIAEEIFQGKLWKFPSKRKAQFKKKIKEIKILGYEILFVLFFASNENKIILIY